MHGTALCCGLLLPHFIHWRQFKRANTIVQAKHNKAPSF
jgi:hypothetical protein